MFYEALKKKYEAEIEESLVTLKIYMNKSVGIGEHPDIIGAIDEQLNLLTASEEKLQAVENHFVPDRVI